MRKLKYSEPVITRVKLEPEQAVLWSCSYTGGGGRGWLSRVEDTPRRRNKCYLTTGTVGGPGDYCRFTAKGRGTAMDDVFRTNPNVNYSAPT